MTTTDSRTGEERKANEQSGGVPGGDAEHPTDIPPKGWFQIAKRGWKEAKADQVPFLSAGVAYYAFLALFPALLALVSLYGLVADPATIAAQVEALAGGALPADVQKLITDQINLVASRRAALSFGVIVGVAIALFSASGGMANLMTAVSLAYDEEEKRGFIKKRALALVLTLGAIVFMVIMLALIAVLPPLLERLLGGGAFRWLLQIAGYFLMFVIVAVALAILYRFAPDRDAPKMKWVSVGALVATVIWLIVSIGFSIYTSTLGDYAKTYGAIAGIVILLFWLWLTAYAILLGAEINAEAEQQTIRDTTKGPEEPLGSRDAVKADSLPPDKPEMADAERDTGQDRSLGKKG
ncbi:MAG TPA: YihY/virulence factor BrkB family protein [Propionibacteriaceae bacterium]|jgi:membrane protein|nr:YihY/virulence factor BrkB family protein [Propionibacteriaceae bacterium]